MPGAKPAKDLNADVAGLGYEQARDELVAVVARLEAGVGSLEESLTLWERGEALAARCQQWLDGARARLAGAQHQGGAAQGGVAQGGAAQSTAAQSTAAQSTTAQSTAAQSTTAQGGAARGGHPDAAASGGTSGAGRRDEPDEPDDGPPATDLDEEDDER